MKSITFILFFAISLAHASDFESIDATLTQSRKIDKETMQLQSKWDDEKVQLEIIEKSYEALLESKKKKLELKKKSLIANNEIVAKTDKDKADFDSIETYLNDTYVNIIDPLKKYPKIKDFIVPFDEYNNKSLIEKFHTVVDVIKLVEKNERLILKTDNQIKTGLIVQATATCNSDDIAILNVTKKEGQ